MNMGLRHCKLQMTHQFHHSECTRTRLPETLCQSMSESGTKALKLSYHLESATIILDPERSTCQ